MDGPTYIPYAAFVELPEAEMRQRATDFNANMQLRRSVRNFDNRPVPRDIIESCLCAAGSSPSATNLQPWHFVAVSDWRTKFAIRQGVEKAEREFYGGAGPQDHTGAVAALGTTATKPYLEKAAWVIAVFAEVTDAASSRERKWHPHVGESVSIACGILITALHQAGLASLVHIPTPMAFLSELLKRPENERPVMLIVTGYPAPDAEVPDLKRKPLSEIADFIEG